MNVTMEMNQVLIEQSDLLYKYHRGKKKAKLMNLN